MKGSVVGAWRFGGASDIGLVRARNEDYFGIDAEKGFLALADGMGGHPCADAAARIAVEASTAVFRGAEPAGVAGRTETIRRALHDSIIAANAAVRARAETEPECAGMGTTLSVAVVRGDTLVTAHAGDSRVYAATDGEILYATEDHSIVRELVAKRLITLEEALTHPQRSVVTRAVGVAPEIQPETGGVTLPPDARVILFSDGLNKMLPDWRIVDLLWSGSDPEKIAQGLVAAANAAGGIDNTTVVVALRA
jgi:protein phosphatase